MSYAQYLRALLAPLGVYDLNAPFQGGELDALGEAFDQVEAALEETRRETCLATAEDWGLERTVSLFRRRPPAATVQNMREALAALLRIGGDSFTLAAINDNLVGCGLNAVASETGTPGYVEVRFPDVPGIPDGFEEMRQIIEDILPCHLEIEYVFWYVTWERIEALFDTWGDIEAGDYTWETLEKLVRDT